MEQDEWLAGLGSTDPDLVLHTLVRVQMVCTSIGSVGLPVIREVVRLCGGRSADAVKASAFDTARMVTAPGLCDPAVARAVQSLALMELREPAGAATVAAALAVLGDQPDSAIAEQFAAATLPNVLRGLLQPPSMPTGTSLTLRLLATQTGASLARRAWVAWDPDLSPDTNAHHISAEYALVADGQAALERSRFRASQYILATVSAITDSIFDLSPAIAAAAARGVCLLLPDMTQAVSMQSDQRQMPSSSSNTLDHDDATPSAHQVDETPWLRRLRQSIVLRIAPRLGALCAKAAATPAAARPALIRVVAIATHALILDSAETDRGSESVPLPLLTTTHEADSTSLQGTAAATVGTGSDPLSTGGLAMNGDQSLHERAIRAASQAPDASHFGSPTTAAIPSVPLAPPPLVRIPTLPSQLDPTAVSLAEDTLGRGLPGMLRRAVDARSTLVIVEALVAAWVRHAPPTRRGVCAALLELGVLAPTLSREHARMLAATAELCGDSTRSATSPAVTTRAAAVHSPSLSTQLRARRTVWIPPVVADAASPTAPYPVPIDAPATAGVLPWLAWQRASLASLVTGRVLEVTSSRDAQASASILNRGGALAASMASLLPRGELLRLGPRLLLQPAVTHSAQPLSDRRRALARVASCLMHAIVLEPLAAIVPTVPIAPSTDKAVPDMTSASAVLDIHDAEATVQVQDLLIPLSRAAGELPAGPAPFGPRGNFGSGAAGGAAGMVRASPQLATEALRALLVAALALQPPPAANAAALPSSPASSATILPASELHLVRCGLSQLREALAAFRPVGKAVRARVAAAATSAAASMGAEASPGSASASLSPMPSGGPETAVPDARAAVVWTSAVWSRRWVAAVSAIVGSDLAASIMQSAVAAASAPSRALMPGALAAPDGDSVGSTASTAVIGGTPARGPVGVAYADAWVASASAGAILASCATLARLRLASPAAVVAARFAIASVMRAAEFGSRAGDAVALGNIGGTQVAVIARNEARLHAIARSGMVGSGQWAAEGGHPLTVAALSPSITLGGLAHVPALASNNAGFPLNSAGVGGGAGLGGCEADAGGRGPLLPGPTPSAARTAISLHALALLADKHCSDDDPVGSREVVSIVLAQIFAACRLRSGLGPAATAALDAMTILRAAEGSVSTAVSAGAPGSSSALVGATRSSRRRRTGRTLGAPTEAAAAAAAAAATAARAPLFPLFMDVGGAGGVDPLRPVPTPTSEALVAGPAAPSVFIHPPAATPPAALGLLVVLIRAVARAPRSTGPLARHGLLPLLVARAASPWFRGAAAAAASMAAALESRAAASSTVAAAVGLGSAAGESSGSSDWAEPLRPSQRLLRQLAASSEAGVSLALSLARLASAHASRRLARADDRGLAPWEMQAAIAAARSGAPVRSAVSSGPLSPPPLLTSPSDPGAGLSLDDFATAADRDGGAPTNDQAAAALDEEDVLADLAEADAATEGPSVALLLPLAMEAGGAMTDGIAGGSAGVLWGLIEADAVHAPAASGALSAAISIRTDTLPTRPHRSTATPAARSRRHSRAVADKHRTDDGASSGDDHKSDSDDDGQWSSAGDESLTQRLSSLVSPWAQRVRVVSAPSDPFAVAVTHVLERGGTNGAAWPLLRLRIAITNATRGSIGPLRVRARATGPLRALGTSAGEIFGMSESPPSASTVQSILEAVGERVTSPAAAAASIRSVGPGAPAVARAVAVAALNAGAASGAAVQLPAEDAPVRPLAGAAWITCSWSLPRPLAPGCTVVWCPTFAVAGLGDAGIALSIAAESTERALRSMDPGAGAFSDAILAGVSDGDVDLEGDGASFIDDMDADDADAEADLEAAMAWAAIAGERVGGLGASSFEVGVPGDVDMGIDWTQIDGPPAVVAAVKRSSVIPMVPMWTGSGLAAAGRQLPTASKPRAGVVLGAGAVRSTGAGVAASHGGTEDVRSRASMATAGRRGGGAIATTASSVTGPASSIARGSAGGGAGVGGRRAVNILDGTTSASGGGGSVTGGGDDASSIGGGRSAGAPHEASAGGGAGGDSSSVGGGTTSGADTPSLGGGGAGGGDVEATAVEDTAGDDGLVTRRLTLDTSEYTISWIATAGPFSLNPAVAALLAPPHSTWRAAGDGQPVAAGHAVAFRTLWGRLPHRVVTVAGGIDSAGSRSFGSGAVRPGGGSSRGMWEAVAEKAAAAISAATISSGSARGASTAASGGSASGARKAPVVVDHDLLAGLFDVPVAVPTPSSSAATALDPFVASTPATTVRVKGTTASEVLRSVRLYAPTISRHAGLATAPAGWSMRLWSQAHSPSGESAHAGYMAVVAGGAVLAALVEVDRVTQRSSVTAADYQISVTWASDSTAVASALETDVRSLWSTVSDAPLRAVAGASAVPWPALPSGAEVPAGAMWSTVFAWPHARRALLRRAFVGSGSHDESVAAHALRAGVGADASADSRIAAHSLVTHDPLSVIASALCAGSGVSLGALLEGRAFSGERNSVLSLVSVAQRSRVDAQAREALRCVRDSLVAAGAAPGSPPLAQTVIEHTLQSTGLIDSQAVAAHCMDVLEAEGLSALPVAVASKGAAVASSSAGGGSLPASGSATRPAHRLSIVSLTGANAASSSSSSTAAAAAAASSSMPSSSTTGAAATGTGGKLQQRLEARKRQSSGTGPALVDSAAQDTDDGSGLADLFG